MNCKGDHLWSGSFDRTIRVWDLATQQCQGMLTCNEGGHTDPITCMALVPSANEEFILSGGVDGFMKMWNPAGDRVWECDEGAVVSALYSAIDSFGRVKITLNILLLFMHWSFVRKYQYICGIGGRKDYVAYS